MMTAIKPSNPYDWRPVDEEGEDDLRNLMNALSPEDRAYINMLLRTGVNTAEVNVSYTPQTGDVSPQSTAASSDSPIPSIDMPTSILDPYAPPHKDGMSITARRRKARRQNRVATCSRSPVINESENISNIPTSPSNGPTTMMIRNVPKRYTQRMLMQEIIKHGFEGTFDFFYLPTDISSGRNLGYAFVNFFTSTLALAFKSAFHKRQLPGSTVATGDNTNGSLSISVAVVQGLQRNLDNLVRNASVHRIKNPEYLPLVMDTTRGSLAPYTVASSHGKTNRSHTTNKQNSNDRRHDNKKDNKMKVVEHNCDMSGCIGSYAMLDTSSWDMF